MQIYSWYKQHTKPNLNLRLREEPHHWPEAEQEALYYGMKNSDKALVTILKIFANALPVPFSVNSFDCHYFCVMSLGTVVLFFKHTTGRFFKKKQQ